MRVHLVGVNDAKMGGLARLFAEAGHAVSASDVGIGPAERTALESMAIRCFDGFAAGHIDLAVDALIIADTSWMTNVECEEAQRRGLTPVSLPDALRAFLLEKRRPLVVVGSDGVTSVASICAFLLIDAGLEPGYLLGRTLPEFGAYAALGSVRRRLSTGGQESLVSKPSPFVIDAGPWGTAERGEVAFAVHPNDAVVVAGSHGALPFEMSAQGRLVCDARDAGVGSSAGANASAPVSFYAVEGDNVEDVVPTWLAIPCKAELPGHVAFDLFVGGSSCGRFTLRSRDTETIRHAVAAIAVCAEEFGVFPSAMRRPLAQFEEAV